ncbi:MAG: hypothetical protein HZT43_20250 [Exiguobacterium profundum]|nr:MAG: hypothetical protein HZT43_20250 [Exiguobacterium profundum]
MRRRGWLADQDEPFQAEVLAAARLVSVAPGGFLFHVADDPGGVYGLAAGGIGAHLLKQLMASCAWPSCGRAPGSGTGLRCATSRAAWPFR